MNSGDAVLIERAREHLAEYTNTPPAVFESGYHAAVFAVHVDELLRLVENLGTCQVCGSRPVLIHKPTEPMTYRPACGCDERELAGGYAGKHEARS